MVPHDVLFRSTFSDPGRAAELLQCILDPDVLDITELATLQVESGTFVDEKMRSQHTDLLGPD